MFFFSPPPLFSLLTFLINFCAAVNRCCKTTAMKSVFIKSLMADKGEHYKPGSSQPKGRSHENFRTEQRDESAGLRRFLRDLRRFHLLDSSNQDK